jgi:hypothetical protein
VAIMVLNSVALTYGTAVDGGICKQGIVFAVTGQNDKMFLPGLRSRENSPFFAW